MPSTGVADGGNIVLLLDTVQIDHLTENSWEETVETKDATTKDGNGAKEYIAGDISFTASASVLFAEDDTTGVTALRTAQRAKSPVTVRRTSGVTGDVYAEGSCIITSVSESAPDSGVVTASVSFQGTGNPSNGTES